MALKVGELFASFDLDSSGMNATVRTIESSMEALGANMVSMGSKMQSSITAPIESFAKQAISAGMDFTSQMSTVEAISGATAAEMEKLNAEALKMGSTTQFTATQAGEALEYMAMAGWKTDQMLSGLAPIMNLAAASGEDLGTTADIVTDALTAFGLKAEDAGHFSDILAVASSNANTNVSMMGETFKYIAPVAGALGYKAEDVAVAIGLMANSGIKASQAGTSLRAALSQMANPSDKAESAMKKLGIRMTDSSGRMKPFSELVQNLRSSFSGLPEAQKVQYAATIFGQEAMSGMLAIINASDEDIKKLTQSVNECDGATQRMADTVLNNARGDWTLFQSAVEGAQVALFKLNEGAIRSVIQGMTSLVDRFNGASDASKQAALNLALVAAAMGPVMVFGGQMLLTLSRIGVVLGALVSPIGLAATGLALFALAATDANNTIGTTLEAMASKAAEILPSVTSHAESAIAEISTRIPKLSESLVNGIETMLPAVVESAGGIITAMLDAFTQNADSIMSIGLSIMTSIVNSIASSAPTLIPSAFSAIVSALTALIDGAPELLESGINLAGKIIEGIKNTDWAAMGTDLMTSITGALESAAAMATEAIKKAVSGIIDAIQAALGIDEGDTLDEIGKKVIDGIKNGMTAAVLTMLDAMKQIGSSIWNGIKTGLGIGEDGGETESAGEALIGKIVTGIENAVSGALDTVKAAVSSIWSTVKSALGLGSDGGDKESADNIGFDIVGKIISGLQSAVSVSITVVKDVFGGIWDAIKSAISGGAGEETGESMAFTAASSIVSSLISGFRSAVTGVIDTVKSIFGGIWDAIKSVFGFGKTQENDSASDAEEAGRSIMTGMKDGVTGSKQAVTDAAAEACTAIILQFETAFGISGGTSTVTQGYGQALMDGIKSGMETNQENVNASMTTFLQGFAQTAELTFNTMTGMIWAFDVMTGISRGITSTAPNTVSAINLASYSVMNAAKSIMSASAGFSIGRDMMQGLVNGIRSMSGTLASAARSAVSSAIAAMRKAADAHSPSRKTIALGQDMDEGGAIGLSGGMMAEAAKKSIEDTVRAFTKGAYVTDLSVGTVATSRQAARQNAEAASAARSDSDEASYARAVGTAIAERLIESGVLNRRIVMNEREVGEEIADPVSQRIDQKAKSTVLGRSAQGVIG